MTAQSLHSTLQAALVPWRGQRTLRLWQSGLIAHESTFDGALVLPALPRSMSLDSIDALLSISELFPDTQDPLKAVLLIWVPEDHYDIHQPYRDHIAAIHSVVQAIGLKYVDRITRLDFSTPTPHFGFAIHISL
jgi:hypothetical protein